MITPMTIARGINPVSTGKAIVRALKNTGDEAADAVAKRAALEAGKDFTYWFGGLIGIAVGVLNPLLMMRQYKSKGVPAEERNALVVQEAANQAVNVVVHMMCYFGLSALMAAVLRKKMNIPKELTKKGAMEKLAATDKVLFEKYKQDIDIIDITKILVANIGGFLGQGVVRPILGSTILMKWKDKQEAAGKSLGGEGSADKAPKMQSAGTPGNEDQMIQELMKSLQQQSAPQAPQPPMPAAPQMAPPSAPAPIAPPVPPAFPGPAPIAPPQAFPAFPPPPPMPMPANNFVPSFPAAPAPSPFVRPYLK